jgi:hypothetical protein
MLTHSRELTKTVDLFPLTDNTRKNHARPIPANGQNEKYRPDIKVMLSFHVETVVLMSIEEKITKQKTTKM